MKKISILKIKKSGKLIPCPYNNLKVKDFNHTRNVYSIACIMCNYNIGEIKGDNSILCSYDDYWHDKQMSVQKYLLTEKKYLFTYEKYI